MMAQRSMAKIRQHGFRFVKPLVDGQVVFGGTTELDMFTGVKYMQQTKKEQAEGKDLDMADLRSAGTLATAPGGHGTE